MSAGFTDYLREAFHAKPLGMFVSPNWIGLAGFGIAGLLNPGFWLVGAGLELGYLFLLTSQPRFRHWVDARRASEGRRAGDARVAEKVEGLTPAEVQRFRALEERCRAVLAHQQSAGGVADLQFQAESLGRLSWIYLGLLQMRRTFRQIVEGGAESAAERIRLLETQLLEETDEHVLQSLRGQLEILRQRAETQREGRAKIDFVEAELDRIEQQVELIREQSLLAGDPGSVAQRIDAVSATLGGTTQWIRDQQSACGEVNDLIDNPPPIPLPQTL